jgi:hypothetical protein
MSSLLGLYSYNGNEIKIVYADEIIIINKSEVENITKKSITNNKKGEDLTSLAKTKSNKLLDKIDIKYVNKKIEIELNT